MDRRPMVLQFGAGAIGRGFLGQLWTEAGYDVVFADVNRDLINRLNARGSYPLRLVDTGGATENKVIRPIRAIESEYLYGVVEALMDCDFACTAVGVTAFLELAENLAMGLSGRMSRKAPLNIICCENLNGAAQLLRDNVTGCLPWVIGLKDFVNESVAFVDASVGRMVPPDITVEPRDNYELLQFAEDPLSILAEPYAELPIDGSAWIGPVPPIPGLLPKTNFAAYVARKLFTHNGGHALLAYEGYQRSHQFIWQAAEDPELVAELRGYWDEVGEALIRAWGFPAGEQRAHEADLLQRFRNRALGDTVERVGRDVRRKVRPDDRLVGAALLCAAQNIEPIFACRAIAAAYAYNPPKDPTTLEIQHIIRADGIRAALSRYSRIDPDTPLADRIATEYATIVAARP